MIVGKRERNRRGGDGGDDDDDSDELLLAIVDVVNSMRGSGYVPGRYCAYESERVKNP